MAEHDAKIWLESEEGKAAIGGKDILKVIAVPGKLVNSVVKG
mgnify:CR=1 FL=1